jgi:hypothetical protein
MPEPLFNTARVLRLVCWAAAAWIAWELLFYEQFKLTGDAGSIDGVFQPLANWFGIPAHEKPIRLGVGIMEIIAAVLVLFPRTRVPGAALTLGLMSGAICFHTIGPIGIDPYNDGAMLFKEACFTFVIASVLAVLHRGDALSAVARFRAPAQA